MIQFLSKESHQNHHLIRHGYFLTTYPLSTTLQTLTMSSEPYTGPSAAHMLATRTFAASVMSNHHTSNQILDDSELAMLREFSADPSSECSSRRSLDVFFGIGVLLICAFMWARFSFCYGFLHPSLLGLHLSLRYPPSSSRHQNR